MSKYETKALDLLRKADDLLNSATPNNYAACQEAANFYVASAQVFATLAQATLAQAKAVTGVTLYNSPTTTLCDPGGVAADLDGPDPNETAQA